VTKLCAQTLWSDRVDQNKDLLSRNYVLQMGLCSAMDHQGLTKVGNEAKPLKNSEMKLYFVPI
jgi:hypothetical protein